MGTNMINLENTIDMEDLPYIESDLKFSELVSVAFLLYADTDSPFILQKLIILSQQPPTGEGFKNLGKPVSSDILLNYAKFKPYKWRQHIVEALAIIRAKMVIRKLGLKWQQIHHQYLPHVAEISEHVHPLVKALYYMCERLTPFQSGSLIHYINNRHRHCKDLSFFDFSYLEIFLLHWLSKGIIVLGSKNLEGSNVEILIEYFKFNDMLDIRDLLVVTIDQNIKDEQQNVESISHNNAIGNNLKDSGVSMSHEMSNSSATSSHNSQQNTNVNTKTQYPIIKPDEYLEHNDRYAVSKKNAGYVLIINQSKFYIEKDPKFKHLIPNMTDVISDRQGTNVDRDKLKKLFSLYGYKPLVFENLTHLEILHQIRETVKKSLLKDSLIICILSHGMEGVVFGSNSVPVSIAEIKEILTADTLNGKPKILIIQACQRNIISTNMKPSPPLNNPPEAYADILLALSSMPGTDALRHTEYGSWFVESLCKFVEMYAESKHMFDILTAVKRDISRRKGDANEAMLPFTSSTLRKEFYLPSK